jgi:hypothetical protein
MAIGSLAAVAEGRFYNQNEQNREKHKEKKRTGLSRVVAWAATLPLEQFLLPTLFFG